MPTFKQKRDQNHYYEDLMEGYPNKKWYIQEDEDTNPNLRWDCMALEACAIAGLSYEQAREFLDGYNDDCVNAYTKELEDTINVFKEKETHSNATFLLNKIVEVDKSIARDFSIFESERWADLSITLKKDYDILRINWDKEGVMIIISLNDNDRKHKVFESGSPNKNYVCHSSKDISHRYTIDIEDIDRALTNFARFFSNDTADIQ